MYCASSVTPESHRSSLLRGLSTVVMDTKTADESAAHREEARVWGNHNHKHGPLRPRAYLKKLENFSGPRERARGVRRTVRLPDGTSFIYGELLYRMKSINASFAPMPCSRDLKTTRSCSHLPRGRWFLALCAADGRVFPGESKSHGRHRSSLGPFRGVIPPILVPLGGRRSPGRHVGVTRRWIRGAGRDPTGGHGASARGAGPGPSVHLDVRWHELLFVAHWVAGCLRNHHSSFLSAGEAPPGLPRWLDQPVNSPVRLDSGRSTYEPAVTGRKRVCDIEVLTDSTHGCTLKATSL